VFEQPVIKANKTINDENIDVNFNLVLFITLSLISLLNCGKIDLFHF